MECAPTFGVSDSLGFYVDVAASSLAVDLDATASRLDGTQTGTAGLFKAGVADNTSNPSQFAGTYNVTLAEPDGAVTIPDLDSLTLAASLTSTVSQINLKLTADFDPGAVSTEVPLRSQPPVELRERRSHLHRAQQRGAAGRFQ